MCTTNAVSVKSGYQYYVPENLYLRVLYVRIQRVRVRKNQKGSHYIS